MKAFVALTLVVLVTLNYAECKTGYIFTSPGRLQKGANESMCVMLNEFEEDVFVHLRLVDNGTVLAQIGQLYVDGEGGCVNFPVPDVKNANSWKDFNLEIVVTGQTTDYRFTGKTKVRLFGQSATSTQMFIQTDKPQYKPGQLVRFRILSVDDKLRPIADPTDVVLMNPLRVRMNQWKDKQSKLGLLSLEFQLSDEPVMGTWVIEATVRGKKFPMSFKVKEYVLPKYEVTVTPPSYLTPQIPSIDGKVCAKYTYGKPVRGKLRVEVCLERGNYYYRREGENRGCAQYLGEIGATGCATFSVESIKLGLPFSTYSLWSAHVSYNASVEEEATGITLYGSAKTGRIEKSEIKIKFDDVSSYFKPGLPFTGKVVVTRPDGTAAPGEKIQVIASNYYSNAYVHLERNYTTDAEGSFYFALPKTEASLDSLRIEARAVRYAPGVFSVPENYHSVPMPRAYHYLKPWYSPSNSFLDIATIKNRVRCGESIGVDILYTSPVDTVIDFHYQIVTRGNIVKTGKMRAPFSWADFDSSTYEDPTVEGEPLVRITTVPPPPPPVTSSRVEPSPPRPTATTTTAPEIEKVEGLLKENEINDLKTTRNPPEPEKENKKQRIIGPVSTHTLRLTFTIPLTTAMASGGKLLVYYVRTDGETVADFIKFEAENCLDNQVKMDFAKSPVSPGEKTTLLLRASGGSLCAIGVVDKSVLLLGGSNQITVDKVYKTLNEADPMRYYYGHISYEDTNKYCLDQVGIPDEFKDEVDEKLLVLGNQWWDLPFRYDASKTDSMEAFTKMGFSTATNLDIMTRPCDINSRREYHEYEFDELEPMAVNLAGVPGPALARSEAVAMTDSDNVVTKKEEKVRTYFPETWLWDIQVVSEIGELDIKRNIPDTITTWVGSAICTHAEDGLGVSNIAEVTAFQPFFVSYTLPYSVIRGERIPLPVTVFNYMDHCLTIRVQLDTSSEGFDLDGESRLSLCVCGQDSTTHRFMVTPTTLGEVNMTVSAESVLESGICSNALVMSEQGIGVWDSITRPLLVESEGIPEEYTISSFFCPNDTEDSRYSEEIKLNLPDNVILDSARGYLTIIGDLMGTALTNLDNLVKMPYGCGEQNMASFTPNIYVMKYLFATDRLTPDIEEKARGYMKIGYQRQLRYRHSDGSYSAFGPNSRGRPGSTWLTAFVVKSLAQARPYIYVDQEDLDRSIAFFKDTQDNHTGCFPRIGRTSSYLKGGQEEQANSTLTSYILIAMLEADISPQDPAVLGAVRCLQNDMFTDMYTLTLVAYALTLQDMKGAFRHQVMERLHNRVIEEEGQQHWERKDKPEKPKHTRPWWYYRAPSAEVEMTAYALLSLLVNEQQGGILIGQPIVQWLSRQRNAYGGFSSTQDTVVALQALAEYGALVYSDGLNMVVTVTDEDDQDLDSFQITTENSLIPRQIKIENLPTSVKLSAAGVGCALVQANARYNIEGETPKDPAFDLQIKMSRSVIEPTNCDRQQMQVCARFTVPSQVSNMAIIEVKMVTGWVPDEATLKSVLSTPLGIERYEIDKNLVNFYFDEISSQKSCVYFDVVKELEVNNTQPGRVHVYDYYETDYSVKLPYEIESQCYNYYWRPRFEGGIGRAVPLPAVEFMDANVTEPRFENETSSSSEEVASCPVCLETMPNNFESLFCEAAVAYKTVAGRDGNYPLKLMADLRPTADKKSIQQFAKFALDEGCTCAPIEKKDETKVMILGPMKIFSNESKEVTLDETCTIIPLSPAVEKAARDAAKQESCRIV